MLSEGVSTRKGRRSAYLHRDRIHGVLRARRGARLTAITNGGAIPDTADYDVIEFPDETLVGKVNEDFAIESLAGDIFLLGNRSWRIRRVASGKVWVEDAKGLPPSIPFWLAEAPARTRELSAAVSDLRKEVAARRDGADAIAWLTREVGLPDAGADQIVQYVNQTHALLGCVPTQDRIVAERFFDEAGGMQLVIHSSWGGRINRAWGLALRKRFCVSFDRELQAAATDDGIVLSLVEQHSFPIDDVFQMLRPAIVERELTQAVLASPFFTSGRSAILPQCPRRPSSWGSDRAGFGQYAGVGGHAPQRREEGAGGAAAHAGRGLVGCGFSRTGHVSGQSPGAGRDSGPSAGE